MILTSTSGILKQEGVSAFLDSLRDVMLADKILMEADELSAGQVSKMVYGLKARISAAEAEASKAEAEASKAKAEASNAKELTLILLEFIKAKLNADEPGVQALIKVVEIRLDSGGPLFGGTIHASGTGAEDDQP
jgi:hypothetical protein